MADDLVYRTRSWTRSAPGATFREIAVAVDADMAARGDRNCHQLHPGEVLGHRAVLITDLSEVPPPDASGFDQTVLQWFIEGVATARENAGSGPDVERPAHLGPPPGAGTVGGGAAHRPGCDRGEVGRAPGDRGPRRVLARRGRPHAPPMRRAAGGRAVRLVPRVVHQRRRRHRPRRRQVAATTTTQRRAPRRPRRRTVTDDAPAGAADLPVRGRERHCRVDLGASWHEGCPVAPENLRLVTVSFVNFDGATSTGQIVVNADVVDDIVEAFRRLYDGEVPDPEDEADLHPGRVRGLRDAG